MTYSQLHYLAHKEVIDRRNAEYRKRNAEALKRKRIAYNLLHRDEKREWNRRYYQEVRKIKVNT